MNRQPARRRLQRPVEGAQESFLSDPSGELSQVLRALLEGVPEPTARRLSEQLWRSPRNPFTFAALGVALAELGQTAAALAAFERAHYLQPDSAHILYHYGLVLLASGRPQEARLRLQAALRLSPGLEEARIRLAALEQGGPGLEGEPPVGYGAAPTMPPVRRPPAPSMYGEPPLPGREVSREPAPRGGAAVVAAPRSRAVRERDEEEEADDLLEWAPPPPPGFLGLVQDTLRTWGQQPLIWLVMLLVPNGVAAWAIEALRLRNYWLVALVWTAALCIGAVPLLRAMASQYVYERPSGGTWGGTALRVIRGACLLIPYLVLTVHVPCAQLCRVLSFPPELLLLATLVLGLPLHVLFAPALIAAVTDGPGGFPSLGQALSHAGPRSWLHLGAGLTTAAVLGGALAGVSVLYTSLMRGTGSGVMTVLAAAAVAMGESVWAIVVAVSGVDSLREAGALRDTEE